MDEQIGRESPWPSPRPQEVQPGPPPPGASWRQSKEVVIHLPPEQFARREREVLDAALNTLIRERLEQEAGQGWEPAEELGVDALLSNGRIAHVAHHGWLSRRSGHTYQWVSFRLRSKWEQAGAPPPLLREITIPLRGKQFENRDRASLYAELQQVIGRCVGSEAAAGWRPTEDIQAQSLVHLDRVEVDSGGWPLYAPDARLTARSITLSFERSSLPAL